MDKQVNGNSVAWQAFGVQHVAEYRTRKAGAKVATEARVDRAPWQFFCLNVDEKNAAAVGAALINRIARENGWRDGEAQN